MYICLHTLPIASHCIVTVKCMTSQIHQLPSLIFKGKGRQKPSETQQGHDIGAYLLVVMETR